MNSCLREMTLDILQVGSADHHIHYYDLRNISQPLYVFSGHRKAVSYVKFLSSNELASASTDSTLRLWDVKDNLAVSYDGTFQERKYSPLNKAVVSLLSMEMCLHLCCTIFHFSPWRFDLEPISTNFQISMILLFFQLRTFRGHTNEKNFVGLTVNSEYIACGSETNEVFVYHRVRKHLNWFLWHKKIL
jgi:WD40 repeat protein